MRARAELEQCRPSLELSPHHHSHPYVSIGVLRAVEHLAGSMSRAVPAGTRLWVKSADEAVVWERAEVLSQAGSVLALRRAAPAGGAPTEASLDLDFADAHECNDEAGAPADGVPDMTALRHLHEPAVLENLTARV